MKKLTKRNRTEQKIAAEILPLPGLELDQYDALSYTLTPSIFQVRKRSRSGRTPKKS
jgi:hypothetical protein